MTTNPFYEFFLSSSNKAIDKWHHYFEIYNHHFARFIGKSPSVLEIGVQGGGSLQMWRSVFGPGTKILGVDIDPRCQFLNNELLSTKILIGDQANPDFLNKLGEFGPFDIVIDDGGHTSIQILNSFLSLYPRVTEGGVYLVEDLHCSYWPEFNEFGQGFSFLDYASTMAPKLTWWHLMRESNEMYTVPPNQRNFSFQQRTPMIAKTTKSISFYDSIVVFEKSPVSEPYREVR